MKKEAYKYNGKSNFESDLEFNDPRSPQERKAIAANSV